MRHTSADELRALWRRLGLEPGEVLLCHSFLPSLGMIEGGPAQVVATLREHLGPRGTLVAPTFTYSYTRGEVYDVERSPSTVGALGDIVRGWPEAVRGLEPNFSHAAVGPDAAAILARDKERQRHPFGPNSPYARMLERGLRVLLLGVDFTALALFMHLEKVHQVSYRQDKTFRGVTRQGERQWEDHAIHFVRSHEMEPEPRSHRARVGALIDEAPDCRQAELGYGVHRAVPGATVAKVVAEALARDPFFLIKEPVRACRG